METKLASAPRLTAAAQTAVTAFQQAVDRGQVTVTDEELRARQAQRFRAATGGVGTRQQLDAAIRVRGERGGGGRGGRRAPMTELRRSWTDTLRPAWKSAVLAGKVRELAGAALEFEKRLLKPEDGEAIRFWREEETTPR